MKFLLAFVFTGLNLTPSTAQQNVNFSKWELEHASPHSINFQKRVLKEVLQIMKVDGRDWKTPPQILTSESILDESSAYAKAAASQGMPFWALEKGVNVYLIDYNVILLGSKMKLHNLAHEYVHFVQVQHYGNSREDFQFDDLEVAAILIQKKFKLKTKVSQSILNPK